MATIKKAVKKAIASKVMSKIGPMMKSGGTLSPSKNAVSRNISNLNKAKDGAKFPDLNKDGKITKADILKGRGVIAKSGMKMKKAQDGGTMPDYRNMSKVRKVTTAKDSADYRSGFEKASSGKAANFPNKAGKYGQNEAARRGLVPKKAKVGAKMKMGGKCKNGC